MKVKWTDGAADDLTEITEYIGRESPDSARRVSKPVYDLSMSLADFPHKGPKRKSDDACELLCTPLSCVILYEIIGDAIFIQGIVHTSRNSSL
jgi:plasmid stabilization system protein ParE